MMVRIGNFLFHYRNALFPVVYLLLFVPSRAVFPDGRIAAILGLLVAVAGQALRAVTIGLDYIIRGGRNRQVYAERLVEGGVFAHCRNPLYVGNFLILLGVGLASNSRLFLAIGIPFFLFAYSAIVAAEENFLRGKFGADFDAYCARVHRWIPRFSGFRKSIEGMTFNWRRLITAEYGSAYLWMAAYLLVMIKNLRLQGVQAAERPWLWILGALLVLVTLGWALARYLKKSGALTTPGHT